MLSHMLESRIFIPDGVGIDTALSRTTHMGIGAHQDDLEFMALHGILECFRQEDKWFAGVTCTDGAGSSRTGPYAHCSDDEMKGIRRREQNTAARIGEYSFMAQLGYPSEAVKRPDAQPLHEDLMALLRAARPQVVYTHNPADKHASHVAVFAALLKAIRALPSAQRPARLIGCEVWRGLDWMDDRRKVLMDVSARPGLSSALNGVFDSQIAGGKRYDLAVAGRRRANATFLAAHTVDTAQEVLCGIDLTPLAVDENLSPRAFIRNAIEELSRAVDGGLAAYFPN